MLGLGFLGGQGYEYAHAQIGGWNSNTFGASFFTLTGMHGLHVAVGVGFLIALWIQTTRGVYTQQRFFGLTAGTLYWHFVDVIWVLLFFLFYCGEARWNILVVLKRSLPLAGPLSCCRLP